MIQATGGSFVTGDLLVSRNALLSSAAFLRLFRSKLASGLFQKSFHFDLFSEERLLHKLQVSGSGEIHNYNYLMKSLTFLQIPI